MTSPYQKRALGPSLYPNSPFLRSNWSHCLLLEFLYKTIVHNGKGWVQSQQEINPLTWGQKLVLFLFHCLRGGYKSWNFLIWQTSFISFCVLFLQTLQIVCPSIACWYKIYALILTGTKFFSEGKQFFQPSAFLFWTLPSVHDLVWNISKAYLSLIAAQLKEPFNILW